jgi:hypothetical protein
MGESRHLTTFTQNVDRITLTKDMSSRVSETKKSDYWLRLVCYLSVRPSVSMQQLGYNWMDFLGIQ